MEYLLTATQDAAGSFLPQGVAYSWNWKLLTLHVASDALIGLSFVIISAALTYLVVKARRDIPFSGMLLALGGLMVAGGLMHLLQVLTVWQPVYWFSGTLKAMTAIASVGAAVVMRRVVPVVLRTIREAKVEEAERIKVAAAAQTNEAKSQFMATMSHELRTPLNAIVGYADLLQSEMAGPINDGQATFLKRLRSSAGHLLDLITQVLEFERINTGRERAFMERVDISTLLEESVLLVAPIAMQKHLRISTAIPPGIAFVTDATRLRQIVLNLLTNAVKYTEAGEVELRARIGDAGLMIEVADSGIGISAEDQLRIFDPFWQADRTLTRKVGGIGLGLSIADRFTRLIDGSLRVESEPGKGTTFYLKVPAGALPDREVRPPPFDLPHAESALRTV